jgi:MEMO1 family protein
MNTALKAMQPNVAGSFYPASKTELQELLKNLFNTAREQQKILNPSQTKFKVLIAPHAGYQYSGLTAAHAYKFFNPKNFKKAIIIGPAHRKYCEGLVAHTVTHYETPLGISPRQEVSQHEGIIFNDEAFAGEHSVEAHLPFIQYRLQEEGVELADFPVTLLLYGDIAPVKLAKKLEHLIDEQTLLVLSSDLSHYHNLQTCQTTDELTIEAILSNNAGKVAHTEACGRNGICAYLMTNFSRKLEPAFIHYSHSALHSHDENRVVGYVSIGYQLAGTPRQSLTDVIELHVKPVWPKSLNMQFKHDVLSFLRNSLKNFLHDKTTPELSQIATKYSQLNEDTASFVTLLTKEGHLRGCIGSLIANRPLHQDLVINAIKAACEDPRFEPVLENELENLKIEVSILATPKFLRCRSEFELLNLIEPHKHGVIVQQKNKRATFLPQVWEKFNNKVDFMNALCKKADLKPEAWRNPKERLQIFVYETVTFCEE